MVRVGVVGGSGYTALELLRLLARHPEVEVTRITSRDLSFPALEKVHPSLNGLFDLSFCALEIDSFVEAVDVAFCCLPHAASAEVVGQLLDQGLKVIDFSADYRLDDVATFEQWYGVKHPDPERVGHVAYGIPELFRNSIRSASLVANPGCFPSSVVIPLTPLIAGGLVNAKDIVVDSKTGVSGAGRKASLKFHYPECNESIFAYGVGTHRHMPEMDQIIKRATGVETEVLFTPHLVPMDRGILSTIYLKPNSAVGPKDVMTAWADAYGDEPFVRLVSELPTSKQVSGTNFCDLYVTQSRGTLVVVSVLDNLVKGASGAAVQNFNLLSGYDESLALI